MTASGTLARVVFDESHNEAWTIRPEVARAMQPAHPGDASYARAAAALTERDFVVVPNVSAALTAEALRECEVLVIAHPSDPSWERTTGTGSPRLTPEELDAIEAFVAGGGGLIVLGETEQEKYGNNLNELLERFEIRLGNDTVQDYAHSHMGVPSWVLGELSDSQRGAQGDLLARVHAACFYRAGTLALSDGGAVIARSAETADPPRAALAATTEHGAGRVALLADSDLFGDDCLGDVGSMEYGTSPEATGLALVIRGYDKFAAAQMIVHALQVGDYDVSKMITALEGWKFLAPKGIQAIRPQDHAMLQPMFRVSLSQVNKVWTPKVLGIASTYQTAPPITTVQQ